MKREQLFAALQPLINRRLVDILDGQQQDRIEDTMEVIRGWTVTRIHLVTDLKRIRCVGLELHDLRSDGTPAWPAFSLTMNPAPVLSVEHTGDGDCIIHHNTGHRITIRTDDQAPPVAPVPQTQEKGT